MKKISHGYLLFISIVSALGGLLFGYDWVVIGGAKIFYESYFGITDSLSMQGWAMSCALIGCLFGAALSGWLSDRYGRKKMLVLSASLFLVSALGTGFADAFYVFVIFRILGGIGIGMASNLSPMYIAEVAPANLRGRLVSLNQMTIVIGILAAQLSNYFIAEPVSPDVIGEGFCNSWNVQYGWRWMFWAMAVPALVFLLSGIFLPESPRWLINEKKDEKALSVLLKIHGKQNAPTEYEEIVKSRSNHDGSSGRVSVREIFSRSMRPVILIGVVLAVLQQWSGINIIFNYAHEIFSAAGYGVSEILMNIVITGVTNVVFTIVSIFLVDRIGRRPLLLIGAGGLACIYAVMGLAYYFHFKGFALLITVVLAIACYAMTLAPVMWVVISEIFPNRIRGIAMSVATCALWISSFLITYTFPVMNGALGVSGTFWIYAAICISGFLFILAKVPETKNKSLETIEKELIRNK